MNFSVKMQPMIGLRHVLLVLELDRQLLLKLATLALEVLSMLAEESPSGQLLLVRPLSPNLLRRRSQLIHLRVASKGALILAKLLLVPALASSARTLRRHESPSLELLILLLLLGGERLLLGVPLRRLLLHQVMRGQHPELLVIVSTVSLRVGSCKLSWAGGRGDECLSTIGKGELLLLLGILLVRLSAAHRRFERLEELVLHF
mmetsp:Transcript_29873/g.45665  ORF Transcript_29873/g.45665 Transcript_29873/m.45665 type:complete len:204 (-) Transcript_29873:8-619(-)